MIEIENCGILENASLKNFCTFKIGGNAKYVFVCHSISALLKSCVYCIENSIKFKVIGFGANLLFDDAGFNGAIIVNRASKIILKNNSLYIHSGAPISAVINKCFSHELAGLECLAGIPASVGGAVFNNLGSGETTFGEFVEWVEGYELPSLIKKRFSSESCGFSYRTSAFKNMNFLITKVKLTLPYGNKAHIRVNIINAIDKKIKNQPLDKPSAGSVFKRGNIIPAKIIDELGLKGTRIRDACISTKHAGFIVNTHSATSQDVKQLISLIQNKVKETHGETLEPEIEFVDF